MLESMWFVDAYDSSCVHESAGQWRESRCANIQQTLTY